MIVKVNKDNQKIIDKNNWWWLISNEDYDRMNDDEG